MKLTCLITAGAIVAFESPYLVDSYTVTRKYYSPTLHTKFFLLINGHWREIDTLIIFTDQIIGTYYSNLHN